MMGDALVAIAGREDLPDVLTNGPVPHRFGERRVEALPDTPLRAQEVLVGYWNSGTGELFPDFMMVRDEDLGDTHAWLSAYAGGLTPITQWCRIWTRSQLSELLQAPATPSLDARLGPWIGAVLAECAAQARMQLNLKTLSGTLALSSASFAAARAQAIWGRFPHFPELARRHDELSERLRARTRPIAATRLLTLWHVLAGTAWTGREPAEARTLQPFRDLFDQTWPEGLPAIERAARSVPRITDVFDLPDLSACVTGTQRDRVEALDRLGATLRAGPRSAAIDAILGFAASLIEPGAAVMPDLLRRFEAVMPTAEIWAGAFAGLWAPVRVMSEHQGLGRLVGKALLSRSDLFAKPAADIAFEELVRWLPAGQGDRSLSLRGMAQRALEIELLPGVTAPFQLRPEPARPTAPAPSGTHVARQRALELEGAETARPSAAAPTAAELAVLVDTLAQRLSALESKVASPRRGPPRKAKT